MLTFSLRPHIEEDKIVEFLNSNKEKIIGKYSHDKNLDKEKIFKNFSANLIRMFTDDSEDLVHIYLLDENKMTGACVLTLAKWDSSLFKLKIGKLSACVFNSDIDLSTRISLLKALIQEAKNKNFDLVFARIPLEDMLTVMALENIGGILTDILITFQRDLQEFSYTNTSSEVIITDPLPQDIEILRSMARNIFKIDHFHSDPKLPTSLSDEVYAEWIKNSLDGLADKVLVARRNQKAIGFITCKIEKLAPENKVGIIDLVGVDPNEQGRGVGSLLVSEALRYFKNYVYSAYVGTQARNINAMRLYTRAGFKPVYSEATIHLWLR
jgi:ribosomal protein S18 acetylase RimI-like enzyme